MSAEVTEANEGKRAQSVILGLSVVICLVVAFLILGPRPAGLAGSVDVSFLPTVNATLNSIATVLLLLGFGFVKAKRLAFHKGAMVGAFSASALFLVTYVVYHWFKAGPAEYVGAYKPLYLFILSTHIVLAAVILPFVLTTMVRGWMGQITSHKKIAPYTFTAWLYVSVTGVLIYWMVHV